MILWENPTKQLFYDDHSTTVESRDYTGPWFRTTNPQRSSFLYQLWPRYKLAVMNFVSITNVVWSVTVGDFSFFPHILFLFNKYQGWQNSGGQVDLSPPLPTFFWKTVNKAYFFDVQECGAPPLFFNFCHPCIFILLVNFIRLSFESSLLIQLWNENKKQKIQVCSRKNYRH